VDDHCIAYSSAGEGYSREVVARREHLAALGVQGFRLALAVLSRGDPPHGVVHTRPVERW
jgi:hypothetical protein